MMTQLKRFCRQEDGAVTVDWVVLTAFLVGMTLIIIAGIMEAATDPADSLGAFLTAEEV